MNLALFNFVDCTIENTVDHPYLEEWFWGSLNTTDAIGYTLEAVTSVDPSLVLCSVPIVATNFILPLGDYTSVDSNDRLADPGLLIGQETYPEFKLRKYYLCAILVLTECNVNEVTNVAEVNISEVRFLIQFWDFAWDTDHFETTPFIYGGVICLVNAGVENLSNTVAAPAGPCCTFNRGMSRVFEYDNCGETKLFKAVGLMPCD